MQVAVTPTYSHARDLPFKRVIGRYHPCQEDPKRHSLGLDLDSWLPHIMLVLWLSVGLLCTDMQCLFNRAREFRVIYSKSSTTSKIMSLWPLMPPLFVSPREEVLLPRMPLWILKILLMVPKNITQSDLERAEHTAAPSANAFGMCSSSSMMKENNTGHATV